MLPGAVDSLDTAMNDALVNNPDLLAYTYAGYMEEERLFEPELQAKVDAVPEDAFYDDALYEQMHAAAKTKVVSMSEDDRRAFLDSYTAVDEQDTAEVDAEMEELRNLNPWAETFSLIDILWVALALGTAFSIGKGKD
jgi:hypothetical protein